MSNKMTLLIFIFFFISGCSHKNKEEFPESYFDKQLEKHKHTAHFEEDSEHGYIKIGKLLTKDSNNAIVVDFDSDNVFSVYELKKNEWVKIYHQKNAGFARINSIETFIEDYNFDGIKDIGIKNQVSNGTGIMSFHLWLSNQKTFQYIPAFENIGTPIIFNNQKMIKGFKACCVFSEIEVSEYYWNGFQMQKKNTLEIADYPHGKTATLTDNLNNKTKNVAVTSNQISELISMFGENWNILNASVN